MRWLAGFALLIAAAAAFPQAAPETDFLHDRPNSKREYEIRPGIRVCALYGRKGWVSRMLLRPTPRPGEAWRDSIPAQTINDIVHGLIQAHPLHAVEVKEFWIESCRGQQLSSFEDLVRSHVQECSSHDIEVHLAILDFNRLERSRGMYLFDDSVVLLSDNQIAERAAILKAGPAEWCAR